MIFVVFCKWWCVVSIRVLPFSSNGQSEAGPEPARNLGSRTKMCPRLGELSVQRRKFFTRHLSSWRGHPKECQRRKSWGLSLGSRKSTDPRSRGEAAGSRRRRHGERGAGVCGSPRVKSTVHGGATWGLRERSAPLLPGGGNPSFNQNLASCLQLCPR